MKKIMILMMLMVAAVANLSAKTVKQLVNEYKHQAKAESMYVSPFLMKVAKMVADKDDMDEASRLALKKVKSVRILTLDDCSKEVKAQFVKEVEELNDEEYQPMMLANSDGEQVKIMAVVNNDVISELVIFAADKDDCSIIQMTGKLTQDDIQFIVDEQTTKKSKAKKG